MSAETKKWNRTQQNMNVLTPDNMNLTLKRWEYTENPFVFIEVHVTRKVTMCCNNQWMEIWTEINLQIYTLSLEIPMNGSAEIIAASTEIVATVLVSIRKQPVYQQASSNSL